MTISNSENTISIDIAKQHYENFPVASFLVKKELRKDISLIYAFARTADDFADEGNYTNEERLIKLNNFEIDFLLALKGNYKNEYWRSLHSSIISKNLSHDYFIHLLKAFKQDVLINEYESQKQLINYCKYSANPIGRLILELHDIQDEKLKSFSDNICTALQLTNFWQDVSIDLDKERIYIPIKHQNEFGVKKKDIINKNFTTEFKNLIRYEVELTQDLFNSGKKIIKFLPGRLKYEILWTIKGGEEILSKIKKNDFNVLNFRPKLNKTDFIKLLIKSILRTSYEK